MSDLESFPRGALGLAFLEPAKGSKPESTVLTGGRPMGTALLSPSLLRLRAIIILQCPMNHCH